MVAALVVAATATVAFAAVTIKSLPTATFSGASVTVSGGNLSGLGNDPATGELTSTGQATYTCHNGGKKGTTVPGQNPVPAQSGDSGPFDLGNSQHNGRGTIQNITATVTAPGPTPSAQDVGCGGNGATNWTVTLDSLTALTAHLEVYQDGNLIFCRNYTLGEADATGTAC